MYIFTKYWKLNNVLKSTLIQRQSQMKVYNNLFIPSLLYGHKIWNKGTKGD